jgi:hypothetical protein
LIDITDLAGFPGGSTNFLREDGTFAAPAGGGGIGGTIALNQVAFATATDTLGGNAGFTFITTSADDATLELVKTVTPTDNSFQSLAGQRIAYTVAANAFTGHIADGLLVEYTNELVNGVTNFASSIHGTMGGQASSGEFAALYASPSITGTPDVVYGVLIDGFSATSTENYGIYIGDITGATTNRSILTGTGIAQFGDDVWAKNGSTWKDVHAANFVMESSALRTDTTDAHTGTLQAYDVDGAAYLNFLTLTNGNTPSMLITPPAGGSVTIQATTFKSSDGTSGATQSIVIPAVGTITVKNGLITAFA